MKLFHKVDDLGLDDLDHAELFSMLRPAAIYSLLSTFISVAVPSKILKFLWQSPLGIIFDDPMDAIDVLKDIRNGYKTIKSLFKLPSRPRTEKFLWIFGFYLGLVRIFVLQVYTGEIDRIMSSSSSSNFMDHDHHDDDDDDDDFDFDSEDKGIARVSVSWHAGNLMGLVLGLVGATSLIQRALKRSPVPHFLLQMDMISFAVAFLTCFFQAENGFFTYSSTFLLGLGSSLLFTQLISSKFFPSSSHKVKGKAVKEGRIVGRMIGALLNFGVSMSIVHEFQFGIFITGTFLSALLLLFISNFQKKFVEQQQLQQQQQTLEPTEEDDDDDEKVDLKSIMKQAIKHRKAFSHDD